MPTDVPPEPDADELFRFGDVLAPLPDTVEKCRAWGWSFAEQGRLDDGRKALARAVRLDPSCAIAMFQLALVLLELGDFAAGVEAIDRAAALGLGGFAPHAAEVRRLAVEALARKE